MEPCGGNNEHQTRKIHGDTLQFLRHKQTLHSDVHLDSAIDGGKSLKSPIYGCRAVSGRI